jgi:hypothetical protein
MAAERSKEAIEKGKMISNCLAKKDGLKLNNSQFNAICRQEEVASYLKNNSIEDLQRLSNRLNQEIWKRD